MSIRNIKIKNYKCFRDESIDLSKLTVLTGRNSAGKSSFIQSLLLYELAGGKKKIYTNNVFGLNLGFSIAEFFFGALFSSAILFEKPVRSNLSLCISLIFIMIIYLLFYQVCY